MSNTMLFAYIFGGVWCGVGIIFFIIGFFMYRNQKNKEGKCTAATTGKVVDLERGTRDASELGEVPKYYPVFEYSIGGQVYRKVSGIGFNKPKLNVGQSVTIYYDPERPEKYYAQEYKFGKNVGSIFLWVGSGCFLVGVVGILCCLELS